MINGLACRYSGDAKKKEACPLLSMQNLFDARNDLLNPYFRPLMRHNSPEAPYLHPKDDAKIQLFFGTGIKKPRNVKIGV